jgi:hypothetical protein
MTQNSIEHLMMKPSLVFRIYCDELNKKVIFTLTDNGYGFEIL